MRWDVVSWAAAALLLIAAETMVPGAFLLWMGLAAAVVCLVVLVLPGLSLLTQIVLFVVLSILAVLAYRKWFRRRERPSDQPLLNRRAQQLVGQVLELEQPIVDGRGRVKVGDAFWSVSGPDLPVGTRIRVVAVAVDGMTLKVQET